MEDRSKAPVMSASRALVAGGAAGLAGGLAEVVFMGAYCSVTGTSPAEVLRLITFTFFDAGAAFGANGHYAGLLIHFALSLAIGISFGAFARIFLKDDFTYSRALLWGTTALAAIWAMNFYILLPAYNGLFVRLVNPEAALFSKLSFGVALALGTRFAGVKARAAAARAHTPLPVTAPAREVNESVRITEKDMRGLLS